MIVLSGVFTLNEQNIVQYTSYRNLMFTCECEKKTKHLIKVTHLQTHSSTIPRTSVHTMHRVCADIYVTLNVWTDRWKDGHSKRYMPLLPNFVAGHKIMTILKSSLRQWQPQVFRIVKFNSSLYILSPYLRFQNYALIHTRQSISEAVCLSTVPWELAQPRKWFDQ